MQPSEEKLATSFCRLDSSRSFDSAACEQHSEPGVSYEDVIPIDIAYPLLRKAKWEIKQAGLMPGASILENTSI